MNEGLTVPDCSLEREFLPVRRREQALDGVSREEKLLIEPLRRGKVSRRNWASFGRHFRSVPKFELASWFSEPRPGMDPFGFLAR